MISQFGRDAFHLLARTKDAVQTVASAITAVAVLVGGFWTYRLFVQRRLKYPRLNVQHKIFHWEANDHILLHVAVETKSVGEVILRLESLLVRIQQLMPLPDDVMEAMNEGRDPVAPNESEVEWPEVASRRCDWKNEAREIEPGEAEEHHFDFVIPADVQKLEVYSHITNAHKARRYFFWKSRNPIGWNTTTVYSLDTAESEMAHAGGIHAEQGVEKKAPKRPSPFTKQGPPKVQPQRPPQPASNPGSTPKR